MKTYNDNACVQAKKMSLLTRLVVCLAITVGMMGSLTSQAQAQSSGQISVGTPGGIPGGFPDPFSGENEIDPEIMKEIIDVILPPHIARDLLECRNGCFEACRFTLANPMLYQKCNAACMIICMGGKIIIG